jgi:PAS domain S-box-containing protein
MSTDIATRHRVDRLAQWVAPAQVSNNQEVTDEGGDSLKQGPAYDERLQLLIDTVVDYGIFVLDSEGHVQTWNSGAAKLKGYRSDEIIGRHFSVFYPPESAAAGWPAEELKQARQHGRFEDEGWRVRKDGSRFWANVVITALRGPSGELTGFAKITRDLTERRLHEERVRASEERLRLLIECVQDYAIFMLDPDGTVRGWNSGAQAIKGYQAHEIVGRHFSVFYTPEDQLAGKPALELRTAAAQGRVEDDGWRVRKDGSLFWANVVLTAMKAPSGELLGFAKITRDMTERRRLEDLERSSRRMNEFLATLAHELRNPLAPVRNALTLMQLEPMLSPTLRNSRDIIDRQISHLTRLVDDLLDVGRVNTGKVKLRREPVRMQEVVARSVETVRPVIEARGHQLTVSAPAEPVWVHGDPTRMAQILQNLLINAAKYTPDGGHVEIRTEQREGFVDTSVTDSGRGLAASQLESIFELFVQGDNSGAPHESGLGIGLTLARSLAERHGGAITAHSPGPGLGSTFVFRMPAGEVLAPGDAGSSAGEALPKGQRIMVVDDNRDSADSTMSILRALGHDVLAAYDGPSALELARRMRPDVVLLDLAMPGADGFETLKLLRVQPGMYKSFVIAMTGYGAAEDKQRTREAGFDAHLVKPIELDGLMRLLYQAGAPAG